MQPFVIAAQPAGLGHGPAEIPRILIHGFHADRTILSDRRVKVQVFLSAYCIELDFELNAHSLITLEADKRELVLAERRVEFAHAFVLPQGIRHWTIVLK